MVLLPLTREGLAQALVIGELRSHSWCSKAKPKKPKKHERCFPLSTFHAKWPAWGLLVGSYDFHPCHLMPSLTSLRFYEDHLHHSWALTA